MDIFSWKCEAHNLIVSQHRSCPVCVSAKRSQLHAANMAHMPRYLFEQTLDVRTTLQGLPTRSVMKTPCAETILTADMSKLAPCEKRYKVNYLSNFQLPGAYTKLHAITKELLFELDVTTDVRLCKLRLTYQKHLSDPTVASIDIPRIKENFAIDMWYEFLRVTGRHPGDIHKRAAVDIHGEFVAYFKVLFDKGQRLVDEEVAPQPKPTIAAKYVLNHTSSYYGATQLTHTTKELLRELDKYEGKLGKLRMARQVQIEVYDNITERQAAIVRMAQALWNQLGGFGTEKVKEQFINEVVVCYNAGQRLTYVEVPAQPTKPERQRSYADDVYDYIMTGHKELYHRQCLLESKLDSCEFKTEPFLMPAFRDLARDACDFYTWDKMPNCNALDTGHVYTLQTILVAAFLEGKRR